MRDGSSSVVSSDFTWSGYLLGFSLSGFFDGILLHQILQWHHLLLGLEGEAFRDLRVQILADGLFHALMYVVAAIGLWLLWRGRAGLAMPGGGRRLLASGAIGFGVWHILDGVLSHWIIGLHRIRMDSPNPLFWDLAWFILFGLVPLAFGLWLRRRDHHGDHHGGGGTLRRATAAAALVTLLIGAAGSYAALPPQDRRPAQARAPDWAQDRPPDRQVLAFFPAADAAEVFAAAAALDARIVWSDHSGALWTLALPAKASGFALYRHGAWLVGDSVIGGCLTWTRSPQLL